MCRTGWKCYACDIANSTHETRLTNAASRQRLVIKGQLIGRIEGVASLTVHGRTRSNQVVGQVATLQPLTNHFMRRHDFVIECVELRVFITGELRSRQRGQNRAMYENTAGGYITLAPILHLSDRIARQPRS